MKKFTFVKNLTLIFAFVAAGFAAYAQSAMVMKIESPSGIAGYYDLYRSSFGAKDDAAVAALPIKLAIPALGCSTITNDLSNSIGFIDRGTCNLINKVKFGQAAGATVVIICNNDNAPTNPGGTDASITIKSFLMEKTDCDKIKLELAKGEVTASFEVRECRPYPPSGSVWGADFDGGLNGWTITTDPGKGFEWTGDGNCNASFMPASCLMRTPTICNGAISFNGNLLNDNAKCKSTNTSACISSVISPKIDLSAVNFDGLTLQFNQSIRQFLSNYYVIMSYDDGLSWPDTLQINRDAVTNDPYIANQKVKVSLCGVPTDATSLRLQFQIRSHYYFWGIDDVFVINESFSDPQTNNNFWAGAPQVRTPVSQVTDFIPLSDIKNNGNVAAENTILNFFASKVNSDGTLTLDKQLTNDYGAVAPCEQVENQNFGEHYQQPAVVGQYQMDYIIEADGNSNLSNDRRTSGFLVTEDVFSNGLSRADYGEANYSPFIDFVNPDFVGANKNRWSLGTSYYFPKGSKVKATEFRFGVEDAAIADNPTYSALLTCSVYKLLGNDTDLLNITSDEKVLVGYGLPDLADPGTLDIFVDNTTEGRRDLAFQLVNISGKELVLEDDGEYLFVIHVDQFTGADYFPFLSFRPESNDPLLRWAFTEATELAFNNEEIRRHYGTVVSRDAADGDVPDDRLLYTRFFKKMYSEIQVDEFSGTKDELAETSVAIYPNPANADLFIDMNLDKVSKNVSVDVYDITGRKLISQKFDNIKSESLKINTASLGTGAYVAKVLTDEGFVSKKVMIKK